jgi:excinuclease UvrABC nuclease subunit
MGLEWSALADLLPTGTASVPSSPGLYRLLQADKLLYVGESEDFRKRLTSHLRGPQSGRQNHFSLQVRYFTVLRFQHVTAIGNDTSTPGTFPED